MPSKASARSRLPSARSFCSANASSPVIRPLRSASQVPASVRITVSGFEVSGAPTLHESGSNFTSQARSMSSIRTWQTALSRPWIPVPR